MYEGAGIDTGEEVPVGVGTAVAREVCGFTYEGAASYWRVIGAATDGVNPG